MNQETPSDKKIGDFEPTVVITRKEYEDLVSDRDFLNALERAGVDNWSGYSFAIEEYNNPEE